MTAREIFAVRRAASGSVTHGPLDWLEVTAWLELRAVEGADVAIVDRQGNAVRVTRRRFVDTDGGEP